MPPVARESPVGRWASHRRRHRSRAERHRPVGRVPPHIDRLVRCLLWSQGGARVAARSSRRPCDAKVVGGALNRLSRSDSETAAKIEDLPRTVAFRDVLIHGCATIDDAIVWQVVTDRLFGLIELLAWLLEDG
ncbi:MAG: DUF86 domain-containing protein [Microthrixaceae bacterium]|nr:DUF86 domain-containing protein [Microthrixaceae bacterium]